TARAASIAAGVTVLATFGGLGRNAGNPRRFSTVASWRPLATLGDLRPLASLLPLARRRGDGRAQGLPLGRLLRLAPVGVHHGQVVRDRGAQIPPLLRRDLRQHVQRLLVSRQGLRVPLLLAPGVADVGPALGGAAGDARRPLVPLGRLPEERLGL